MIKIYYYNKYIKKISCNHVRRIIKTYCNKNPYFILAYDNDSLVSSCYDTPGTHTKTIDTF